MDKTQVRMTVTHVQQYTKSIVETYILALVLGVLGAHHFYLNRPWFGIVYFFTFGLLGVGYLVDLFRVPCLVRDANREIRDPTLRGKRNKFDAYLLWFPFGLLGFHLFYLRKPGQGLLYFFTFGVFGIGFLIDLFRIPYMVEEANENPTGTRSPKTKCEGYLFALSPLGLLGAHHYYLERHLWGVLYTFTLGLFGFGWIYDWFRMPFLVERANAIQNGEKDPGLKYVDDAYVLWFPLGWMGWHHFYLNRPVWGFLYFFTFGIFGIGWLIDGCRLPCLVNEHNRSYVERQVTAEHTRIRFGGSILPTSTGGIVVAPPGALMNPPVHSLQPPPYGYQSISYQAPGYQVGYQQGIVYNNHGFAPEVTQGGPPPPPPPPPPPTNPEVQPPPPYEAPPTQVKSGPPKDIP